MKKTNTSTEAHAGTIRAGVISLLVFALSYLWVTGISDLPRAWVFIILFAVCFVHMMQSVVELLVLGLGFIARFSGAGLGRLITVLHRHFPHGPTTA